MLHQMTSDMNKLKRQSFSNVVITALNNRNHDRLAGEKLQQDIHRWLSPPDPWKNHNISRELHHAGSAAWFIQSDTFSEWRSSQSSYVLWIHGKRELSPGSFAFPEFDTLPPL
jgi:hypothetical protein